MHPTPSIIQIHILIYRVKLTDRQKGCCLTIVSHSPFPDLFLDFWYLVPCCWQPLIWQSNPCWMLIFKDWFSQQDIYNFYDTIPKSWILLPGGGQVILDLFVKSLPSWLGSENPDQWENFIILERQIGTHQPVYPLFNVRWGYPFPFK